MSIGAKANGAPTSSAHDAFRLAFETADIFSLYWQPLFKSVGRFQLELAQAASKQSRAAIEFNHRVTQATTPIDLLNAQVNYWQQVGQAYSDATQHINQAFERVTAPPAEIELFPVQKKRTHDTLRLDDLAGQRGFETERKVA